MSHDVMSLCSPDPRPLPSDDLIVLLVSTCASFLVAFSGHLQHSLGMRLHNDGSSLSLLQATILTQSDCGMFGILKYSVETSLL